MNTNELLLDELLGRWTRGEPLEVEELLARAGSQSDELSELIDAFLERAPRREPTPAAVAFVRSLDEPSLLRARQSRKLKLDDLAAELTKRLGLPERARAKVRRHYQALELGQLDPAGVAVGVWVALAGLLGQDVRGIAGSSPAPVSAPAMYRLADFDGPLARAVARPPVTEPEPELEPDEADRLFGVTPSS